MYCKVRHCKYLSPERCLPPFPQRQLSLPLRAPNAESPGPAISEAVMTAQPHEMKGKRS